MSVSRPSVARISAWIAASSAPGTLYSSLAGMIIAATLRRSSRWDAVREVSADMISSIEEIGKALFHLVGDVERDGLDGGGRIDAARGDEHAAIDDEEILDVVRAAPFVDHRSRRIGAHARGAEQMPAAPGDRIVAADVGGAGGFQNLPAARQPMRHHLAAVLADGVVDPRRGNAVAVFQVGIERDAVVLLRQVLADRGHRDAMAVELAEHAVMIRAPRQDALLLARDRLEHRPGAAAELNAVAADEAARQISVVKLLAPQTGRRSAVGVSRLRHEAVDLRIGMEHQV